MIKNPADYERNTSLTKFKAISLEFSPVSLPGVSTVYCQTALVDKSGLIITRMGTHSTLVMVAVLGTP
jgi:hypothetical protein